MDIKYLLDVSSTPPSSDQMEVNAVAGNEVEGLASVPVVLPVPKVMTPASYLNEVCVVSNNDNGLLAAQCKGIV